MNFKKKYGWDSETLEDIEHIVRNTRESVKHIIFGMRLRPARENFFGQLEGEDEYVIAVYDRRDLTPLLKHMSKAFPDRETLAKRYVALLHHFDLPCCCREHEKEFFGDTDAFENNDEPTEAQALASFFAGEDDDEDLGSFLDDDDDDDLASFLG